MSVKVAAVQAESKWLDTAAGVEQVCAYIKEAAGQGCDLIGFPECFVPGFPHSCYTNVPDPAWQLKYQKASIELNSPEHNQIRKACREAGIWAVVGFSEREGSSLYIAQSFINPNGDVVHHRRKIKPTFSERYIFAEGQAESLQTTVKTDAGVVFGGLNCGENLQPLLRYCSYGQGVQINVASWPPMAPMGEGVPHGTCAEMLGDVVTRNMALEGQCFTMACSAVISPAGCKVMNVPEPKEGAQCAAAYDGGGFSAIYAPDGTKLAKAADQFSNQLVVATCELDQIHMLKQMHDVVGHYSRPDLLSLNVSTERSTWFKYSDGRHLKTPAQRCEPLGP